MKGKAVEGEEFYMLGQLIGAYLNQDMEMWADSAPEAVAKFAQESDKQSHDALKREMDLFAVRYHNDQDAEFKRRYGFDFTPGDIGQTVPEFFAMTRAILDDPSAWRRFDDAKESSA